ncbi:VOC family protein [Solicola sp. PLA-1-18]|uniref:VOC family protein n=1 Tax=Solicola sp. PLA-1-18 TaxID=3380532 RepID=UPI003B81EBCA
MTEMGTDWRWVDGVATAWFGAASLGEGVALAGRSLDASPGIAVDLRPAGLRVRLDSGEHARAVSVAARGLGLVADTSVLQHPSVVLETPDPAGLRRFWQPVLGYASTQDGRLADPLRRDPDLQVRESAERRPLRNRIHLDVVRPAPVVEQVGLGEGSGPYGLCHADPDGNEVDLVPGDAHGDESTADWQTVFGAVACYRTRTTAQQLALAAAAAARADDAGFPLLVDLRPGLVVLDTGKDRSDADAHGLDLDFTGLAAEIQSAARELGAVADTGLPRLVQVFLDAADVDVVRAFWLAALGYVPDRRPGLRDVVDPRRLGPVLVFQELDAADDGRRLQRNRVHVELAVPSDLAQARVATAVAAGGRLADEVDGRWRVADPQGNELVVVAAG